jgi:hypothetical protein
LYKANSLYGSLIAKNVGTQYAKDGEPVAYKIPSYMTTDLTIGYRWKAVGSLVKNVKTQLGINNLFDKRMSLSQPIAKASLSISTLSSLPVAGACLSALISDSHSGSYLFSKSVAYFLFFMYGISNGFVRNRQMDAPL